MEGTSTSATVEKCQENPMNHQPPAILNSSLQNTELCRLLQKNYKVRTSDHTLHQSCIFPLSGMAVLILHLQDITTQWPPQEVITIKPTVIESIKSLVHVHRQRYIVCMAPVHGEQQMQAMTLLQSSFISEQLNLLPVHNYCEAAACMHNLAQVESSLKPDGKGIQTEKKKQAQRLHSDEVTANILSQLPLSIHECQVLQDSLGSIRNIAAATRDRLMDATLDREAADRVRDFLDRDKVIVRR